jgi:hypothetical protein
MTYKAFQDFYHEANIKHLLLEKHNDVLISPPFSTEKCRDYSKIAVYDKKVFYIDLDLPPATSKTNAVAQIKDSSWFIPYGIWDQFNVVVELKDLTPNYHTIKNPGKGQFYSVASNGQSACSFPLGYQDTAYLIHIDQKGLNTVTFDTENNSKLHMGTVYCNNKFWSMPRGDNAGYNSLASFDGNTIKKYSVPVPANITRKFTDAIVLNNKLYSLPYGETAGLTAVVEFDTDTERFNLYPLNVLDFAKKYNSQVLLDNIIIGLPYGDEHSSDSNWGIQFNTETKQSTSFDINLKYGGKYRYRCGIAYKGRAVFLPSGTPSCPIISIGLDQTIIHKHYKNKMFGRPMIFKDCMYCMTYDMNTHKNIIIRIDEQLNCEEVATV